LTRLVDAPAMPHLESLTRYLPASLRDRLAERPNLWRALTNIGWLFADRILRLGVGLVVSVWIARYLGKEQFGLLSYATAFVGLFLPFAMLGLESIVVRDLVREPTRAPETMGSAFGLKLLAGLVSYALAVGVILWTEPDDRVLQWLIILVGATIALSAFDTIDYWFQSQVRSKYTVIARNTSFLITAVVRVVMILAAAPLIAFAAAIAIEGALTALGLLIVYRASGRLPRDWRGTRRRALELLSASWPLMFSGLAVAVYLRIDQIMLREMRGDADVGIYAAAARISEVWYFIPSVLVSSVAPAIINARATNPALYEQRMQRLLRSMAMLGYAVAAPVTLLAQPLIWLLYGADYASSGPVLAVHIWAGLFVCLGVAQTVWLVNEGYSRISMVNTTIGALVNIALNFLLIPPYGPLGAAIATMISYGIAVFAICFFYGPSRKIGHMILKALVFRS
jgi:O-antigen/teichoic acid export membrane protein